MFPFVGLDSPLNQGWLPIIWFLVKLFALLFGFIWLRGTLPRYRYDQFMKLGWKVLVPANLAWIVIISAIRAIRNNGGLSTAQILIGVAVVVVVAVAIALLVPEKKQPDEDSVPVTGGGFPLPPLDLRVPEVPERGAGKRRRRAAVRTSEPAQVGAGKEGSDGTV